MDHVHLLPHEGFVWSSTSTCKPAVACARDYKDKSRMDGVPVRLRCNSFRRFVDHEGHWCTIAREDGHESGSIITVGGPIPVQEAQTAEESPQRQHTRPPRR